MGVRVRQKNGSWWVFVNSNGKRTSRKVGSKAAANKVAREIETRLAMNDLGFMEQKVSLTFAEYAERFLNGYSKTRHKPSTHSSIQSALKHHLLPAFGKKPLNEIKRRHVKAFLQTKSEALSYASVRNLKAYLSSILAQAVDDEFIDSNPAAGTGRLIRREDRTNRIQALTWDEARRFEDTMRRHWPRYYPFFLTLLRSGLRLGEALALKTTDVDFEQRTITVRRSYTRGHMSGTKTSRIRVVDMSQELTDVLQQHVIGCKRDVLKKGWGSVPEWLFYSETGTMLDGDNLRSRVFYPCLKKAGIRRIRLHDLRHSYASMRISAGHNILDVSRQLGHASVKMTLDVYAHFLPKEGGKREVDDLDGRPTLKAEGQ